MSSESPRSKEVQVEVRIGAMPGLQIRTKEKLHAAFEKIDENPTNDPVTFCYDETNIRPDILIVLSAELSRRVLNNYKGVFLPGIKLPDKAETNFLAKHNAAECTVCPGTDFCDHVGFWSQIPRLKVSEVTGNAERTRQNIEDKQRMEFIEKDVAFTFHTSEGSRTYIRTHAWFYILTDVHNRIFAFTNVSTTTVPETPTGWLRASLEEICDGWEDVIAECEQQVAFASKQIVPGEPEGPEERSAISRVGAMLGHSGSQSRTRESLPAQFLRSLTKVADISGRLDAAHREQQRGVAMMIKAGGHRWPTRRAQNNRTAPIHHPSLGQSGGRTTGLQPTIGNDTELEEVLQRFKIVFDGSGLVKKVDDLFQRATNIMSIDEAHKAREQGASMRRLSWVTFIFLPLLFVASLYGMNVGIPIHPLTPSEQHC
ncbi:hypothetical protein BZA05DRAFT_171187 [Tricharina praecox]|uniref:uncharacterized protein n=1 Tax=Tricharina praecox TaxID=43433 RepID=UPI00222012F8|nr:uncharacterized protein BZA05DRAFT_171187 [Tricharina praecox]KAI5844235.1 hypothetical protein BZA05DRAFT_171187 [Tricharina praecox]